MSKIKPSRRSPAFLKHLLSIRTVLWVCYLIYSLTEYGRAVLSDLQMEMVEEKGLQTVA